MLSGPCDNRHDVDIDTVQLLCNILMAAAALVILSYTWPCTHMGFCRYSVKWEIRRQAQNQRLLEVDFGISLAHAPGRKDEMGDDDDHSRTLHFQVN